MRYLTKNICVNIYFDITIGDPTIERINRGVFKTRSHIYDGDFLVKIVKNKKLLTFFVKKVYHRCLEGSLVRL